MVVFFRILSIVGKYGARAVQFCWDNKSTILRFIERNLAVSWIVDWILDRLGIKH